MRLVSKITLVLALPVLLLFSTGLAIAQVSGTVSGSWTLNDSPVMIDGDIEVPVNETLTIEPGVIISFQGPYAFRVFGTLIAQGQVNGDNETVSMVTFSQDVSDIEEDMRWRGIRFEGGQPGSILEYCLIENAYAHTVDENPDHVFDDNGGGVYVYGCSPIIEKSIIRNCKAAKHGGGVYLYMTSSLFRNVALIENQAMLEGGGIYMDMTDIPIRNMTIVNNQAGLGSDAVDQDFGGGICFGVDTTPYIRSSIIWRNGNQEDDEPDDDYIIAVDGPGASFMKFSIISQDLTNIDNFVYNEDPNFVDDVMFKLSNDSRGVDGGEYSDDRWHNETIPNGQRINMGIWGGTVLATNSVPVAFVENSTVNFVNVRPVDTVMVRLASIHNIGHAELIVSRDNVSLRTTSDIDTIVGTEEDMDNFSILPFNEVIIPADSSAELALGYIVDPPDFDRDVTYFHVETDGGNVDFKLVGVPFDPIIHIPPADTMIDFGIVSIDDIETRTFEIQNIGHTRLELGVQPWMQTNTGNFSVTNPGADGRRIQPGNSVELTINYPVPNTDTTLAPVRPTMTGNIFDVIQVKNNDRTVYVHLHIFAEGAVIHTSESDTLIDFEFVDTGSSRTLDYTIHNQGNDTLIVSDIQFTNTDFSFELPDSLRSIKPGDSTIAKITLSPSSLHLYADTMNVISNGGELQS